MGVTVAAIAALMAVTGALLNHTADFRFGSTYVQSDWILDWYGIEAPHELRAFLAGDRYITLMGEHLYLNRKELGGSHRELAGAAKSGDLYVVAVDDSILLLTHFGELIERLEAEDGVPAGVRQIGADAQGQVVVRTGYEVYRADADFLRWSHFEGNPATVDWARVVPLEPQLRTWLRRHFRREVLAQERLLLDLHSGRFFGRFGPWVFDAAALLLLLLSLTGTWIWLKRRR
jgi:hypothetical protein